MSLWNDITTVARRAGWRTIVVEAVGLILLIAGIVGLVWGVLGVIVEAAP